MDLLGLPDVTELGDYGFSLWTFFSNRYRDIGDHPVLSIYPEIKLQTANLALRSPLISAKECCQTCGVNVVWRRIRRMAGLGCYKAPVNFGHENLRIVDPGSRREDKGAGKKECRQHRGCSIHDPGLFWKNSELLCAGGLL